MKKLTALFLLFFPFILIAQTHPNPEILQPGAKAIDFLKMRKAIVENPFIGGYF